MNNPETFKCPCAICHKRPATRYCDYVIDCWHPQIFLRDRMRCVKENEPSYETCDVPMCEECAKNIDREIDFCPYHFELYQKAKEIPEKWKKEQARVKRQINTELLNGSD